MHLQQVWNDRQNQEFHKATCLVWRKALLEFGICWLTEELQHVHIFTGSCFYATTYGESKINLRLTSEWCSQKRKPQNDGFISKMFNLPTFLLVLDDMVLSVRAKALSQLSVSLMRLYTQPSLICSPHCTVCMVLTSLSCSYWASRPEIKPDYPPFILKTSSCNVKLVRHLLEICWF